MSMRLVIREMTLRLEAQLQLGGSHTAGAFKKELNRDIREMVYGSHKPLRKTVAQAQK